MKPAPSSEEWKVYLASSFLAKRGLIYLYGGGKKPDYRPHTVAALCLHNQEFGFKRWMVDWLHERSWGNVPVKIQLLCRDESEVDELIADCIEALLPPEPRDDTLAQTGPGE